MSLSLTAPNDGAIVSVRTIDVVGQVTPEGAVVRVNRQRAHVARGAFKQTFSLRRGVNHVHIVATARGYHPTSISVAVRFRPEAGQAASNAVFDSVNGACSRLASGIQELPRLSLWRCCVTT